MSPRLVATVVALLLISPSASAQTVPALAAGVPPQVAPHPINVPAPPDPVTLQKLGLLRERIVQRDQIQREIDQLIVETQTPQEMVVHLELLEVNRTMAEKARHRLSKARSGRFDAGVWAMDGGRVGATPRERSRSDAGCPQARGR